MSTIKKHNNTMIADDRISEHESNERTVSSHRAGSKTPRFHTQLTAYNELGEELWDDHNELLIPGGLFTLTKIAGVDAPLTLQTLNQKLNIQATETPSGHAGPRREDFIFGFAIGIGGASDVFDNVTPVKYKEITIDSIIPFRKPLTADDLPTIERAKYGLKRTVGSYFEYFAKSFETTPVIKAEYDQAGNPSVTDPVNGPDTPINTYVQFTLKISKDDVREFFKLDGGGLRKARVNTISLLTGYKVGSEYKGVRAFSKINFNNEPFDNETKELTVIYKIFI